MRMPVKAQAAPTIEYNLENPEWAEVVVVEEPKQEIKEFVEQPPALQEPETFIIDDNHTKDLENDLFPDTEPTDEPIRPSEVEVIEITEITTPVDDVPFVAVEFVPVYPGCEGLKTNTERKDCMSEKISKLVSRKFNTSVGDDAGLTGVNKVFVQFKVDKTGRVTDVRTRAPHPALDKEASRVINLLPVMQPGKQRGVPVNVIYSLPISFRVDN
ncbi:energy transducer TonB [Dokdonia sinensis]|uniref:Energy transducer TonB n=2 Tax=Dokdonia sinensis TaxID=2479847 RepID=A0A3M0FVT4_9FLAO|nr:energy transducer TonB [Dokdonia sinensis]